MTAHGFELLGVRKSYGPTPVLADLSLAFRAGVNTAVVGPSGCGKSTLLRLLAGLEEPDGGTIFVDGRLASAPNRVIVPPHQRGIAMVFQDLALWPNLTALDNVRLGLSARLARRDAGERAIEALTHCGMESLAHRKPAQLSGGQQQRIALARAIAVRPSFLLFDEPFSSLDGGAKNELLREIGGLAQTHQITIVLVTHDLAEVQTLCRRVLSIAPSGVLCDEVASEPP